MNVLLVDDHALFRAGLALLLKSVSPGLRMTSAASCAEARALAARGERFGLVLVDLKMPGLSGVDAVHQAVELFPDACVAALTGEVDPALAREAIEAGAMGFIPKAASPEQLQGALQLVLAGAVYLPAEILLANAACAEPQPPLPKDPLSTLTERQRDVLRLLLHGAPNKRIAQVLDVGETTVKSHVMAVLRALGAANRTEAVYACARLGITVEGEGAPEVSAASSQSLRSSGVTGF